MEILSGGHLSYCTNIHAGENWTETFKYLKEFLPDIKKEVSPDNKFGIGLRLSARAALELLSGENLRSFSDWLSNQNLYVFTINGFPYGGFHNISVKDNVHKPDWTSDERKDYTLNLFKILKDLLPEGIEGGISTSPISYKPWYYNNPKKSESAKLIGAKNLAEIALYLYSIEKETGKYLHIDLEPEPDGILENSDEVIDFFNNFLLKTSLDIIVDKLKITVAEAKDIVLKYITVCYDVCHFALAWEDPEEVISKFENAGIKVGKVQISSALEARFGGNDSQQKILSQLQPFVESTYLHQVSARLTTGRVKQFRDLDDAIASNNEIENSVWRIHFHVPIFADSYKSLNTTQEQILKVLKVYYEKPFTSHLEVETYTWEVLPDSLKLDLKRSIVRELKFVSNFFEGD